MTLADFAFLLDMTNGGWQYAVNEWHYCLQKGWLK